MTADLFVSQNVIIPRTYQENAVDITIKYLRENPGKNPIVCAATGTGKSVIIGRLCQRVKRANPAARIIIGTHVAELLNQNAEKLQQLQSGLSISFYSTELGQKDLSGDFVFAGIQSIYSAEPEFTNILIVDEVQSISRKDQSMWKTFIEKLKAKNPGLRIVGFSATPFRTDTGSLTDGDDALFDDIIFDYGIGLAIQDGYLAPLVSKGTKTIYDISGVGKAGGEFNQKQLETVTNVDRLTAQAVQEMIEKGKDRRTWLIFCNGVAHSFAVRDELRRCGIAAETVVGDTPRSERERIKSQFADRKIRAVTNNGVWTTGIDIPEIDLIGMLRHTMSAGLLLQIGGRGTRTVGKIGGESAQARRASIADSAKPNCLFLDFARNIERHGFLDQIKAKEKSKKIGDGAPPMKICDECATINHLSARKCKDCGCEFPRNTTVGLSESYDGGIISNIPDERNVLGVTYSAHNVNKEGKTPCLMVKYLHENGRATKEYICLQHSGAARDKAEFWWKQRNGANLDNWETIEDLVNDLACDDLLIPKTISVVKEGKFDRIVRHDVLREPQHGDVSSLTYIGSGSVAKKEDETWDIKW